MVNMNLFALAAAAIIPFVAARPTLMPEINARQIRTAGTIVKDNYIVILKPELSNDEFEASVAWATSTHHNRLRRRDDTSLSGVNQKYHFGKMNGYSGSFDSSTIEEVRFSTSLPSSLGCVLTNT